MDLKKNQIIELTIDSITNEGSGVGRYNGIAVFVPMSAPGDKLKVRIVKALSSYCFGIIEEIVEPGLGRVTPDCPVYKRCGGCSLRHISYEAELAAKQSWVEDSIRRIGGFQMPVLPILPSPMENGYRNKAQYPIAKGPDGKAVCGFYARRTHEVVPGDDCRLQPAFFADIVRTVCHYIDQTGGDIYDEATGKGLFRHLYLRWGEATGEVMVCLVATSTRIPKPQLLIESILEICPSTAAILLNINDRRTNVILGKQTHTLWGSAAIQDVLCDVGVSISPLSFYQVNRQGAQLLYQTAADMAELVPEDILLDFYCGAGTIGLSMAHRVGQVIGVEIVESAVEDARRNAHAAGTKNSRFLCADASAAAVQLEGEGIRPSVVVLDPPRKGCDAQGLNTIVAMAPQRIVMVSCNPATMARDAKLLAEKGYTLQKVQPVDMFPRTAHVECVILMTHST